MEVFSQIVGFLDFITVSQTRQPKIKWIVRLSLITLLAYAIVAILCHEIFEADEFIDYIEPALLLFSLTYAIAAFVIFICKRDALSQLIADIRSKYERGKSPILI